MPCPVCHKIVSGFGFIHKDTKEVVRLCSKQCQDLYHDRLKVTEMFDFIKAPQSERIEKAVEYGGKMGGEYLQSIEKYSLDQLSKEEWMTFLKCCIDGYHTKLTELEMYLNKALDDKIPF